MTVLLEEVSCNLCQSKEYSKVYEAGDFHLDIPIVFQLVRCNKCGLLFVNPRATKETISIYYPDEYSSYHSYTGTHTLAGYLQNKFLDLRINNIKKLIGNSGKILEIGCATGELLNGLRKAGNFEVYGVDFSDYAAKIARAKYNLNVQTGFLDNIKFEDNFFNLVIMKHVFEHQYNPFETLQEIQRILKPGGYVLNIIPNIDSVEAKLFGKYWHSLDLPRHLYHFPQKTLKPFYQKAGIEILEIKYDFAPNDIIGSLSNLCKAIGFPKSMVRFFNYKNILLILLFLPYSMLLSALKTHGRIQIIGLKKSNTNNSL